MRKLFINGSGISYGISYISAAMTAFSAVVYNSYLGFEIEKWGVHVIAAILYVGFIVKTVVFIF